MEKTIEQLKEKISYNKGFIAGIERCQEISKEVNKEIAIERGQEVEHGNTTE